MIFFSTLLLKCVETAGGPVWNFLFNLGDSILIVFWSQKFLLCSESSALFLNAGSSSILDSLFNVVMSVGLFLPLRSSSFFTLFVLS